MQLFILVAMVACVSPQLFSAHARPDSIAAPHTSAPDSAAPHTFAPGSIALVKRDPGIVCGHCTRRFLVEEVEVTKPCPYCPGKSSNWRDCRQLPEALAPHVRLGICFTIPYEGIVLFFSVGCIKTPDDAEPTHEIYFLHSNDGHYLTSLSRDLNTGAAPQGGVVFVPPCTIIFPLVRKEKPEARFSMHRYAEGAHFSVIIIKDDHSGELTLKIKE